MDRARHLAGILLVLVCLSATAGSSSSLSWSWRSPADPDVLETIAFGGGVYVAAGEDGVIYSSPDGTTWSPQSSVIGVGGQYVDALYANGLFLLSGVDAAGTAHVTTSPDGVTWTDSTVSVGFLSQFTPQLELSFGNGSYVVMGGAGDATSPDGTHWISHTLNFDAVDEVYPSLEFANGVFIKAGESNLHGNIFYSSDAVTWHASANMQDVDLDNLLASDSNTFFLFMSGAIYTSTDGNHWTKNTPHGEYPANQRGIFWDGSRFCSFGTHFPHSAKHHTYTSPDGLTWLQKSSAVESTLIGVPFPGNFSLGHTVAFDGTGYVAISDGHLDILHSADFIAWTGAFSAPSVPVDSLYDMIYAGNQFIAVGQSDSTGQPIVVESPDGNTWNQVYTGTSSNAFDIVAYGKRTYVAAGGGVWLWSKDGVDWTPSTVNGLLETSSDVQFGNGVFAAAVNCPGDCSAVASTDGKTWTAPTFRVVPGPFGSSSSVVLGYDGTRFVGIGDPHVADASGISRAPVYTSCDGTTWSHSADISVSPSDLFPGSSFTPTFTRMRLLGSKLIALGNAVCQDPDGPEDCAGIPDVPIVASSTDATHWSVNLVDDVDTEGPFRDVSFDGKTYYGAISSSGFPESGSSIVTSTDLVHWSATGYPAWASVNAIANDGSHVYTVGQEGDILAAAISGGTVTTPGGACHALPSIDTGTLLPPPAPNKGGSSGNFDLFTLVGLLGLLAFRRRAGI